MSGHSPRTCPGAVRADLTWLQDAALNDATARDWAAPDYRSYLVTAAGTCLRRQLPGVRFVAGVRGRAVARWVPMRYRRAVEKLRELAAACDRVKDWPPEDPFLVSAYAFGEVLDGADPLDNVQVAVVVNLPPEEVPWGSSPHGTQWLADQLRLSKGGFEYWWRSHLDPAQNHYIRGPVRFWSHDGPDEAVLAALAARRFAGLPRLEPAPDTAREQLAGDLDAALRHLRQVRDCYWEYDWRKEHRGLGRYPEHELWEAVEGYLDILDASGPPSPGTRRQ